MTLATNTELSLQTLAQSSVTLESGRLAVNSLADAICIAQILTVSEMVPKASAKDTMEVAILKNAGKILAGVGLGLTPFQSVQAFANINGRPCLYGDAMMAIIYASGLLEDYSEEWFPKQSEPRGVKVTMKRKGVATPVSACFSIENAKSAGLLASSPTWQSYTADMLLARARSRCARRAFPDVLGGFYSADEARDGEVTAAIGAQPVPAPATVTRAKPRRVAPVAAPAMEAVAVPVSAPAPEVQTAPEAAAVPVPEAAPAPEQVRVRPEDMMEVL